jgi:hypothetical protein
MDKGCVVYRGADLSLRHRARDVFGCTSEQFQRLFFCTIAKQLQSHHKKPLMPVSVWW